ncbi:HpaA family protein [Helicobacter acinonychis]|uniref:Neuraminyllactose-binding hemagglutinin n=1 Tax=Helicobacter acinonychis (strain Sheeba) TaxID=382638 RepID=Q17YH8_HELAH|nr:HpaA family protein [Helicobacter acinonychis]CAJ99298.1 probable neuraminyllactose-binding hemagglutinin [Helicobacter acinonychis str. Sheeba]STP04583.1 neuraminyllactose-binding hemagglutinin [Helicobacter acinonychis]
MKKGSLALVLGSLLVSGAFYTALAEEMPTKHQHNNMGESVELHFYYPIKGKQEPKNSHLVVLVEPNIEVNKVIPEDYQKEFEKSLVFQLSSLLEKKGYSVSSFKDVSEIPQDTKEKALLVLRMDGNMAILEDLVEENDATREEKVIDMSSGYLNLNFVEPKSEDIIHSFGVDISKIKAVIERVVLDRMNSGGFVPKTFIHKIKETDHDRAIKKIMNQAYHKVMAQVSKELNKKNMGRYEKMASEMKNRK